MLRPDKAGVLLVKLKHIRQEKDGRVYVRRSGFPSVRLREPPGSEAFMAEYARALEATAPAKPKLLRASTGSLAWLCQQYLASSDYTYKLKPSSRAVRRRALQQVCDRHGPKPFALMKQEHVRRIMDEKAGKPEAANTVLKALRALFKWAIKENHVTSNPAAAVPKVTYKSDGYHTWTDDEVRQFEARWAPGTKQRLALALLLYIQARAGRTWCASDGKWSGAAGCRSKRSRTEPK